MKNTKPIVWCIVDKNGKPAKWRETTFQDPTGLPSTAHEIKTTDELEPKGAPHRWVGCVAI